jgi:hypothetical protein
MGLHQRLAVGFCGWLIAHRDIRYHQEEYHHSLMGEPIDSASRKLQHHAGHVHTSGSRGDARSSVETGSGDARNNALMFPSVPGFFYCSREIIRKLLKGW